MISCVDLVFLLQGGTFPSLEWVFLAAVLTRSAQADASHVVHTKWFHPPEDVRHSDADLTDSSSQIMLLSESYSFLCNTDCRLRNCDGVISFS